MYTIYNNGNVVMTVEFWASAIEIAEREAKYSNGQVWIEDSNGKVYN
jgi:hypothetical protein